MHSVIQFYPLPQWKIMSPRQSYYCKDILYQWYNFTLSPNGKLCPHTKVITAKTSWNLNLQYLAFLCGQISYPRRKLGFSSCIIFTDEFPIGMVFSHCPTPRPIKRPIKKWVVQNCVEVFIVHRNKNHQHIHTLGSVLNYRYWGSPCEYNMFTHFKKMIIVDLQRLMRELLP